jgi:hypothetical protein
LLAKLRDECERSEDGKGREGEGSLPFMMLYPYVKSPSEMVADRTASCQTGTVADEAAALPVDQAE